MEVKDTVLIFLRLEFRTVCEFGRKSLSVQQRVVMTDQTAKTKHEERQNGALRGGERENDEGLPHSVEVNVF